MADSKHSHSPSELKALEKELAAAGNAPKKAPGKKKIAGREILWTERAEEVFKAYWTQFREIFSDLRSPDRPTRRMSAFFIFSLISIVAVIGLSIQRYIEIRNSKLYQYEDAEDQAKQISEFLRKQAEEAKHKFSMITLGTFTVELKPVPGQKPAMGVLNMAEVEIVLECDSRDTRYYIEEHSNQARNQITNVFTAIDRDELMTREGKRRIKRMMIERLNTWLPKGKVEELFFSKLVLS